MKILILSIFIYSCAISAEIPSGQATAEGVACDMAKAFINADKELWETIVMKADNGYYSEFIKNMSTEMDKQKILDPDKRSGPKKIQICYKMGKLSKNGPNSYAFAVFNYDEIGFVDVGVLGTNDKQIMNRTFVYRSKDKWFALPRPDLFPLLTMGLNGEQRPAEVVYRDKP